MDTYFKSLTNQQKANIKYIIARLAEKGITNKYTVAAMLSVLSKESGFVPKYENDYRKTSVARIREVFPGIFGTASKPKVSDAVINQLKSDPVKWFNYIYNGKQGNRPGTNDGYDYRGGGLNQITFRDQFKKIGEAIGIDLVKDPGRINELDVATDAFIQYCLNFFDAMPKSWAKHYGTSDINGFADLKTAVKCVYHANAGWGRTLSYLDADKTGGRKKALDRSEGFLAMFEQKPQQ